MNRFAWMLIGFYFWAPSVWADAPRGAKPLTVSLSGLAAECRVTGFHGLVEASSASSPAKARQLVDKAYADAKRCVEQNKAEGKAAYREHMTAVQPQMGPLYADLYAAWLGYMDALTSPVEFGDEIPQEAEYQRELNRVQARLDAAEN